ncbi:uncharacterized protein LACBIDRAFT_143274, partial [Laccaria bicolor S238N-H82]
GPLAGIPIAIKDNIATTDSPTTCSSAMLQNFVSPFDATVVKLLRKAGADIIGKTNLDEFGMGSLNVHSVHGPVVNPFHSYSSGTTWVEREKRCAGGSSGGSAAAVAAGMCVAALGTDTGGSIRLPASYCGIVGFKPSYGLVSRWGVVSFADSLDCVAVMAANVSDAKRIFNFISVYDEKDPTAATDDVRQMASKSVQEGLHRLRRNRRPGTRLDGIRIGIPQEYFPSELSPTILGPVRRAISSLKSQGAIVVPVTLPSTSYALSAYYVLASAEASSNLARYDGIQYGLWTRVSPPHGADLRKTSRIYAYTRSAGFGHEVQKRILLGTYALTADAFDNYFLQAQRVRQLVKNDFNSVFSIPDYYSPSTHTKDPLETTVDVLVHPSAIRTAPPLPTTETDVNDDASLDAYVQDVLTVPASLARLPALNVPIPQGQVDELDDGWPIGISVVGQWGTDELVLEVGEALE